MFIVVAVVSYLVQMIFQRRIAKASAVSSRYSGKETAEMMLSQFNIHGVKVVSTEGELTDNYNPSNNTVNLSNTVYGQRNVAAMAVAAHECGHAVQHAQGYFPVKVRSALVPVVSFASRIMSLVLLGGMLLINVFPQLMMFGIALFAMTTLFSLVTLPVEINASRRALAWLRTSGLAAPDTYDEMQGALKAAAYTYVVAALSSLATLIYYIAIFTGGRRN